MDFSTAVVLLPPRSSRDHQVRLKCRPISIKAMPCILLIYFPSFHLRQVTVSHHWKPPKRMNSHRCVKDLDIPMWELILRKQSLERLKMTCGNEIYSCCEWHHTHEWAICNCTNVLNNNKKSTAHSESLPAEIKRVKEDHLVMHAPRVFGRLDIILREHPKLSLPADIPIRWAVRSCISRCEGRPSTHRTHRG